MYVKYTSRILDYTFFTFHEGIFDYMAVFDCFRDFGRVIMDGYSCVKIPDDVDRDSTETIETVEWTARLDEAFIKNREADHKLRLV